MAVPGRIMQAAVGVSMLKYNNTFYTIVMFTQLAYKEKDFYFGLWLILE